MRIRGPTTRVDEPPDRRRSARRGTRRLTFTGDLLIFIYPQFINILQSRAKVNAPPTGNAAN